MSDPNDEYTLGYRQGYKDREEDLLPEIEGLEAEVSLLKANCRVFRKLLIENKIIEEEDPKKSI